MTGHHIEPRTRRCRNLGHRWVGVDGLWVCVRYGCDAWYDPHHNPPMLTDEYFDEAYSRWLPPAGPVPPSWGS